LHKEQARSAYSDKKAHPPHIHRGPHFFYSLRLLMGETEPTSTETSSKAESASTSTSSTTVTTELVPGLDGVLIHPKVLCSQYARLVKDLQNEIANLKSSIEYFILFYFFKEVLMF